MARKKAKDAGINLDSFLDIMTCLVGILVLIIILTGIDAAQIKVLVPTPMQNTDFDGRPIFIEARNNELFRVPLAELQEMSRAALKDIALKAQGSQIKMLSMISESQVKTDIYSVDLTYALMGQIAIRPIPTSKGYKLVDYEKEKADRWFGSILAKMDNEQEMLTFLVRDDSFEVFKLARGLAWLKKIEVSYELMAPNEVIKFGVTGTRSFSQ
jgi:biopolymer transport protein ExbD